MDSDEAVSKRSTRGRGRGTRGRARGRGRGRGRGRKVARIVSSDEESTQDPPPSVEPMEEEIIVQPPVVVPEIIPDESQKENEEIVVQKIDMEADISQLEAPTFTTIQRGPPEPMLRLKWDHKVSLIGEKVLNPMIHCCDTCLKPILIYGRMIPCKHVFCLKCARSEPVKSCPRCKEKVCRVEQSGLGTVFMCTHGGSRYGNTGCRRTYLSQRDLQAHINHRHMVPLTTTTENTINKNLITDKSGNIVQTNSLLQQRNKAETQSTNARSNVRCAPQQPPFAANLTSSISTISTRTNLITVPIQDSQQPITPVLIQQQHIPELASSNYYNSSSQQQQQQQNTYTGSSNYNASSQQNSSFSNSTNKQTITQSQQQVHNLGSRTTTVPSSGQSQQQQQQGPAYYGQNQYNQYNQMPHYQANRQYDQQNYSNNGQSQQWNQQQYYR